MALSESRGIYFPLGAAFFLGSVVQSRLDMKKKRTTKTKLCGQGDGVHPPSAFTRFLISSPKLQPPVTGTPEPKHTETHASPLVHFISSSLGETNFCDLSQAVLGCPVSQEPQHLHLSLPAVPISG